MWCQKVFAFPKVSKKLDYVNIKNHNLCEAGFVDEAPPVFEASGVSVEHKIIYFHHCLGEFTPTIMDVACLIVLPLFGEANEIVLSVAIKQI